MLFLYVEYQNYKDIMFPEQIIFLPILYDANRYNSTEVLCKLINNIFTSEGLRQSAINKYENHVVTFWKFNVDQMEDIGY